MKNIFKLAAIAIVALSLTVACKSNKTEEPIEDTTPVEELAVIDTVDTVEAVAEEVAAEEPVKKVVKKAETQESKTIEVKPTELGVKDQSKRGATKTVEQAPVTTGNNAPAVKDQSKRGSARI